jgi:hypothetical protein
MVTTTVWLDFDYMDTAAIWVYGHNYSLIIWTQLQFDYMDTAAIWVYGHNYSVIRWTQLQFD